MKNLNNEILGGGLHKWESLRQLDLTVTPLGQVSALSFGQSME